VTRIAVEADCADWHRALPDVRDVARGAARVAAPKSADTITILLTDDDAVRDLNARFRAKDTPTNVLAFPSMPGAGHLGDIALAYGVCAREAVEQGKTLADHLRHLVIHGVLHLGGHDHETDAQAEAMEALERRLLARLGVDDPYAARALEDAGG
jgi:probable rRNA maturation factor